MGSVSADLLRKMAMLKMPAQTQNSDEQNPNIAKNTILRDRVNDEQAKLAKQGPLMIRNPKKTAKGA